LILRKSLPSSTNSKRNNIPTHFDKINQILVEMITRKTLCVQNIFIQQITYIMASSSGEAPSKWANYKPTPLPSYTYETQSKEEITAKLGMDDLYDSVE
jgi:hypothetical protein